MFNVYVIKNQNGKIYIGQTADLKVRLERHNRLLKNKKTSFTSKNKGVWELVYKENFNSREEAIKREKELKSFRGREFIRKSILKKIEI
ncbi:MAG: GIY-YIG nuclease family protein [Parcubacteria group bacterium]|jgi:putative endonuclease